MICTKSLKAGSQITAKSLVTRKIVTRHSTHFKRYIDPISPPKLNLIDDDTNQTVENTSDDGMIYDDSMPAPLRNRIAGPNQPPLAQPNNEPMLNGRNERRDGQGGINRAAVEAEAAAPAHRVRFDENNLRRGRSGGPAPEIPHVLPSAPERSAQMRRDLRIIHGLENNENIEQ